jgi:hypothetical protein
LKSLGIGWGGGARNPTSIETGMRFAASPDQVWNCLIFYEQIPSRPPLHLRILLPGPMRAEGRRSDVGDETRCVYDGGYLLKRVTRIDPWRYYGFDVVEQDLPIGGGIRLEGGSYTLVELPDGSTRIGLETRYVSPVRPRWLWKRIEAAVCHAFHRHILGAMRREVESREAETSFVGERRLRPGKTVRSVGSGGGWRFG